MLTSLKKNPAVTDPGLTYNASLIVVVPFPFLIAKQRSLIRHTATIINNNNLR